MESVVKVVSDATALRVFAIKTQQTYSFRELLQRQYQGWWWPSDIIRRRAALPAPRNAEWRGRGWVLALTLHSRLGAYV